MEDANVNTLEYEPRTAEYMARLWSEACLRDHLGAVYYAADDEARAPYIAELTRANWAFFDVRVTGVTVEEARAVNRRVDAISRPVAKAALAAEEARLRRLARAAEAYTLAHLSGRGKYMMMVGRVFGRAA